MGKYFGTDGFRGKAGVDLTAEHAFKIGRFLGNYYGSKHEGAKIVIGKDTRLSSYTYEAALASGITSSGCDAYLLHVTTTPCVSYITRTENFDCGVMISASHNPFYDNGIKLMNENGEKMDDDLQDEIEKYIDGEIEELPFASEDKIGKTIDFYNGRNRYIGYLTNLATKSFENCKVGLDCANGSSWMIARSVFDALGAKTYVINNEPNGTNINKDAGSTHIEGLQKFVVDNNLDVGFAFDGDADRCLAVDENGKLVDGDSILYLCGTYMKEQDELPSNMVVTTVMSNLGLYKAFDAAGISYKKTAVGDKYVSECMTENGYMIGGEQSGHIIFAKNARTGDGVLTSLKIMEVMIEKKAKLSTLLSGLSIYPQLLVNVRVKSKAEAMSDEKVLAAAKQVEEALGDNGRILLRQSGTEPLVRVMVEAETDELCKQYVDQVAKENNANIVIKKFG